MLILIKSEKEKMKSTAVKGKSRGLQTGEEMPNVLMRGGRITEKDLPSEEKLARS